MLVLVSMIALQFSRESYFGFLSSTVIDSRDEQFAKQSSLILVTENGIVIEVRDEHP